MIMLDLARRHFARGRSSRGRLPAVDACEPRCLLSGTSGVLTYINSPAGEVVTFANNGNVESAIAGDTEVSLNGAPVRTVAYCVDLADFITPNQSYGVQTASTAAVNNGAEIAYLVNHEAASISAQILVQSPSSAARDRSTGLQLAIWSLEYGPQFQILNASAGAMQYANQYRAEAGGQSESATYLDPSVSGKGQGLVVPGQNYTQGFWKNHPDAWPVQGLTIAGTYFSESTLINLLETPPKKGDAALILVHQLIAAELNIINGVLPSADVVSAINQANSILRPISSNGVGTGFNYVSSGSPLGQQMTTLGGVLDSFNSANGG